MAERIRGKVARVLNARELAINRGSEHGVVAGMRFAVLSDAGENITDPDSGDVLGSVYRSKVEVEVVDVKARLSIARTFKVKRRNVGGSGIGSFSKAFEPPKWVEEPQTLRTEETTWEDLDESQSFVHTGDPVEQIVDEADDVSGTHAAELGEEF
jgi:hypothetical protein